MDALPFEERRVINALVFYWRLWHKHSPDLVKPSPSLLELIGKCRTGISFFRQVYHDLRAGSRGKYADFSESEFKQFLEAEYHKTVQVSVDFQAQATAEAYEMSATDDLGTLGMEFARAFTRADLFPHSGTSRTYINYCWNCKGPISSAIQARCENCGGYFCSICGACLCGKS